LSRMRRKMSSVSIGFSSKVILRRSRTCTTNTIHLDTSQLAVWIFMWIPGYVPTMRKSMMYVRLVHLLDAEKRKELMIIYGEHLAPRGFSAVELGEGGRAFDHWPAIEKQLIGRAEKKIRIQNSD